MANQNRTFNIKFSENIISGNAEGIEALKQTIFLMLNTEADQYIIYPYTYGLKTLDLIGKPSYYVIAVLPNRIKQALLSDNRITEVSDFKFDVNRNKVHVSSVVKTVFGSFESESVVNY